MNSVDKSTQACLEVSNLSVAYRHSGNGWRRGAPVTVVRDVSFTVGHGQTLGVVGESGSGKSTVAKALLRLVPPAGGVVRLGDVDLTSLQGAGLRRQRQRIQMVFQDPYSSLNPSMVVGESVGEPLVVHESLGRAERRARVMELLRRVGLSPHHFDRYPYEFSGGQRQRLAIARALAVHPEVLVCDEPMSALDVSTQNQIIRLLRDLQDDFGLSYVFIAHDLAVVRYLADQVAVMYLGEIVEQGPADAVFSQPTHPYTEALLDSVPVAQPRLRVARTRHVTRGEPPDPTRLPPGCSFAARCPYAMAVCRTSEPPLVQLEDGGTARCHLHVTGPTLAGASVRTLSASNSEVAP